MYAWGHPVVLRESPPSVIARKRFGNQACMSLLCLKSQELHMRSRSSCGCSHCANALTGMASQPAGCSWEKASDAIKPNQGLPWSFWRLWQESHSKYNSQGNIHKTELSVCVRAVPQLCSERPPRTAHRAGQLPAVQDEAALEGVMDHRDENSSRRELWCRASLGIRSLLTLQG